MEHEFSKPMRRMKNIYSWVPGVIILICIALSFLLAGIFLMVSEGGKTQKPPDFFDSYGEEGVYSTLDAQYMTYEFAADFKGTNHYYFVFDSSYIPYIVEVHGSLTQDQRSLINYMYEEEETELPAPVTFTGVSAPVDSEIKDYALESYNAFWGEDVLTESEFDEYFGTVYLDTTVLPKSPASGLSVTLFTAAVLLFALAIVLSLGKQKATQTGRKTLAKYSEKQLAQIDSQMNQPSARSYPKEQLYVTDSHVISGAMGFDIVSFAEADRVYKVETAPMRVIAETKDRVVHTLAVVKGRSTEKKTYFQEIYETIRQKFSAYSMMADLDGGRDADTAYEPVFRQAPAKDDIRSLIDEPASALESPQKANVPLGILGAIGASLGGVALWVAIGEVGFIAGIAGFVILKLALIGYKKLGGRLDKKGAVISLIVAAVMILGANVLSYMIVITRAYFRYDASFETVLFVLRNFGSMMAESGSWGRFVTDLVIGYGLSIWASYRMIHSIFTYKD